ncbi:MAG: ACP S-malonyltransferase, partial [Deltaproteobacteria bacterium]|nr:ACP S-malonyltransferase [Deltaproteobacteria bacterium]MBW2130691.1 ACP S-malonyltransferase [Deltaproteobacteria bacterium]
MPDRILYLYPGQGSQSPGMGRELLDSFPEAGEIFDRADRVLGFSLSRICLEGPEEVLGLDLNAQLAVFTISCITADILKARGLRPDLLTGHSSGFYAAAYTAGCFGFEEGLLIVKRAGEILAETAESMNGAMAVIFGLPLETIERITRKVGGVEPALLNTPRQTIISGHSQAVRRAMEQALEAGALDAHPLPFQAAYHSRLMERASRTFFAELSGQILRQPQIPLLSYSTLRPVRDEEDLKETLALQLSSPVRWADLIRRFKDQGSTVFVEMGPGTVLSRTLRWIDRDIRVENTSTREDMLRTIRHLR